MNKVRTLGICLLAALGLFALAASTALASTPPTAATTHATQVKLNAATLNGSVNPNGSEVTECSFEYGRTSSYGSSAPCSPAPGSGSTPVEVSAAVSGLTENSLYHFRVSATSAEGTSVGKDVVFSTPAKLPEWGECVASETHEGRFGDSNCTEPVGKVFGKYNGGYEWYPLVEAESGNHGANLVFTGFSEVEQAPVSIELASGYKITCGEGLAHETALPLRDATSTTAPDFVYEDCVNSEGGHCTTTGAANEAEIDNNIAYDAGQEKEPGSWIGKPQFISAKKGATPAVGMVYKAEEKRGRMWQQIACEGEAVHAFVIGGEKGGEELTTQITPVNTMTESYTATLSQKAGVQGPETLEGHATKPPQALVNGERWEAVGIEATMVLPQTLVERPNHFPPEEVELKATP